MASVDLEYNQGFKIYNANGTRFNNLVLHKATYETVVMSLGDKISGIVYYKNNKLVVNMTEYIMYKNVKYVLVNPPTVIKEGLVSDNGELKGMTKYSFTFYHPMYMLSNFPFSDVAVDNSQKKYLSQNKTFSWIGNLTDYVAKLNKNLEGTQWKVSIGTNVTNAEKNKLSEVLSFDNNTIADALKTAYETWEIPYIVDKVETGTQDYLNGKRFVVQFGLPSNEIYEVDEEGEYILDDNNEKIPFVFKYGQGVGLKNNSRTPKNNKIVTRIAGYGSEDNIPYGYPQIVWTGKQSWNYTINNDSTAANSYPIYDGIVGGQKVRLIKHPFTRTHLMPPIYSETVNKKVNPNATGYNPNTELVDYYDANDNTYPNQIKAGEQSYEIHEFEDIKPEFGSFSINSAAPYDGHSDESITQNKFLSIVDDLYTETDIKAEKTQLNALRTSFVTQQQNSAKGTSGNYEYDWSFKTDGLYKKVKYASSGANFEYVVNVGLTPATIDWDDTMDEQGNYVQSYFKVTIPALGFDLYASAAITQEMTINMRSGACIGCSFPVMVDWDDYKRNFYDNDGNFAPNGTQRNYTKYPNSTNASITLILQKETSTFGTLMPNIYQKPASGDKFVILGISLPTSYITTAEGKLETEMKKYMRDNNVYYYEYPLKFDEHFLISNEHILSQMKPNVIVNFEYADVEQSLYIKQMSIKYNESPLPKYDITLTDDVDVVLNKIGEAIAEYRGQRQYENKGGNSETLDGNKFLRKDINDTASGTIRMLKGLQVGERFVTGLLGEGGIFRKDDDGTTYLECDRMYVRMKAYFDTVEVRRFLHSGGNRIASAAGMKCSRVEYIAANGSATRNVSDAVKFRCYFRAEDNGAKVTNDFVVGDLAYCKETNIDTNLSQHGYWRAVVGVSSNANSSGEHWIDLSKSDCSPTLNDVPIAQDDIIQLGNKTAKARQGAIVEYVSGEDAPSYQIYQGINTYNLDNKNYIGLGYSSDTGRAYMNVYGDFLFGDKAESTYIKYNAGTKKLEIKADVKFKSPDDPTQDTTLEDFASAVTDDIDNLQSQIDGQIETWFYDYDPAVNNAPASNWTTTSERNNHLGDLFYNTTSGYAWRWGREETAPNVYEYKWYRITDVDVVKALADAAKAQDTADHKRRVFTAQPYPPYDVGDLWSNAIFPANNTEKDAANNKYYKDLLTCKTAKAEGGSFAIADWGLTTNYTDDTALTNFVSNTYAPFVQNIQGQVDQKAETWYQDNDPSSAWTTDALKASHVGDIWCNTSQNGGKKTYIWKDFGTSANPRYAWAEQSVPDEVFDKIDGKADIFVSKPTTYNVNDMWIIESGLSSTDMPTGCQSGDIVISNASRVNNYQKTDWSKKDRYTDDTKYNNFISALLNGMPQGSTEATVEAALNAIKAALNQGTTVSGGLVLSTLIGLRDSNNVLWSGINGQYDANALGGGIAAWYGGGMIDHEASPSASGYAKSLFRFDGSGYLAGGNITWDAQGRVAIKDITTLVGGNNTDILNALTTFNNAFHFTTSPTQPSTILNINPQYAFSHLEIYDVNGNHAVATTDYVNENFVTKAFFNRLFQAYSNEAHADNQKVNPNDTTTTINNLKILVGTWTDQYLSALGLNSQSGGGGVGDVTWDLLASNSDTHQIAASHLNVLNGYAQQSWVTSLGYITQTNADLRYLKLSGGTMANTNVVTNLNADKLDGRDLVQSGIVWGRVTFVEADGVMEVGKYINFHKTSDAVSTDADYDYSTRIQCDTRNRNTVVLPSSSGTLALTSQIPTKASWNYDDVYLKLTGGTISNNIVALLTLDNTLATQSEVAIALKRASVIKGYIGYGDLLGVYLYNSNRAKYLQYKDDGSLLFEGNKVWHEGNDGSGSGLDADKLDGLHAGSFYQSGTGFLEGTRTYDSNWNALFEYESAGGAARSFLLNIECHFSSTVINKTFHITTTLGGGAHVRELYSSVYGTNFKLRVGSVDNYWRNTRVDIQKINGNDGNIRYKVISLDQGTITGRTEDNVAELAYSYEYSTCNIESAVVLSATKLQTSRTLWGKSFDGTANVTGALSSVTNIDSLLYFDTENNRIGIGSGNSSPAYTLDVSGTIRVGSTSYTNLIGISGQYFEIGSHGNEIVVSSSLTTMYVNNRVSGLSKTIPDTWYWKKGSGANDWASFILGTLEAKTSIKIGGATLTWVSGQGLKCDENFYSEKAVSALGSNSQSGGGGGVGDVTWDLLASQATNGRYIHQSYIQDAVASLGYITQNNADNRYLKLSGGTMVNTNVVTNLNADKLDGYDISSMVMDGGGNLGSNDKIYDIKSKIVFSGNNMPDAPITGWVSGIVLGSNWNNSHFQNYLVESQNGRWYTTRHYTNGSMDEWKTFAYLTDNVASATKLQTARTLWGRRFDGTANVSGALLDVTNIYLNNNTAIYFKDTNDSYLDVLEVSSSNILHIGYSISASAYSTYIYGNEIKLFYGTSRSEGVRLNSSGNVGIGTNAPAKKLDVAGTLGVSDKITSSLVTGTAPISVTSTTVCTNLNADLLDGKHANAFMPSNPTYIELNSTGALANYGGFIDFHFNGSSADYTSRIIEYQSGRLNINSTIYAFYGGNVGIGTAAPSQKLHVDGNARITGSLQIGDAIIYWDTQAQGLRVTKGLFSEQWISALGANSGGSGGGGGAGDVTWDLLASNSDTRQIAASHLNVLNGYAQQSWVTSQGYLTSSALSSYVTTNTTQDITAKKTFTVQQEFTVTSGSPFTVTSSTVVTNLNADLLDGQHGSYYATASGLSTLQGYFTNGVANSAAKLSDATAKTAWGQTFFTGGTPTSISNAPLSGVTNIDTLLYFDTTNSRIGIGVSSPSSALDVNGKVTINNESGYAIEAYGQLRFNASTDSISHPQRIILGCFTGTGATAYQPFIRFRGNDGTARDFAYMDENNDYKVGALDKAINLSGRNVNIFSRVNTTDDTVVLAMKAISYGRIFIGNSTSNYSPINNTDYKLIVRGNQFIGGKLYLYRPTANSDSGAVWIEYDTNAGAVKLNGNFYATGAVSALGAGTSGGGSTGDFSAIVNSLNQSPTAVGTGFLYSNGGAWSFKPTSLFWKTTDFDLKTALSVFGDYDNHGATNLGWVGDVEDDAKVVTSSMLAYWDGCYSGTSSNLTFCVKGAFGDIVTKNLSSNITFTGNIGIGTTSSTVRLNVNGVAQATELRLSHGFYIDWDNSNANAYTIGEEDGDIYTAGDWYGRWASSSDVRLKDIYQYLDGKLEDIALAPIFSFRWKNKPNKPLELGTSAQYWKVHLSYGVTQTHSGYLALDYGATALAAAVFTARKVLEHEGRIRLLEVENQALRKEIEQLKKAA